MGRQAHGLLSVEHRVFKGCEPLQPVQRPLGYPRFWNVQHICSDDVDSLGKIIFLQFGFDCFSFPGFLRLLFRIRFQCAQVMAGA